MQLADTLTERRKELLDTIGELNKGIALLVGAADKELPAAAAEGLGSAKVTNLRYRTHSPSPEDIADHVSPPSSKCSHCGERGHNKRTCPTLHIRSEEP